MPKLLRIFRRNRCFFFLFLLCCILLICPFLKNVHNDQNPIIIYAGTKFYSQNLSTWDFLDGCPVLPRRCIISDDPKDFFKSSAVIFNGPDFHLSSMLSLPGSRNPKIPYIFWTGESPSNDMMRAPAFLINWTMHYKQNSDIWIPYGRLVKGEKKISVDYEEIWRSKSVNLSVLWLGSNCDTPNKRFQLAQALQKRGLSLDIYGRCGKPVPTTCQSKSRDCGDELMKKYKFYLALENSNCPEYVTEKYFDNLWRGTVPIVAKRKWLLDMGLPANSFVAIDDFPSIESLITYINEAQQNQAEWLKFHHWREKYELKRTFAITEKDNDVGFCALCHKLQQPDFPSKTYADIRAWSLEKPCDDQLFDKYL